MRKFWVVIMSATLVISSWGGATFARSAHSHATASAPATKFGKCTAKGHVSFMFWGDKIDHDAQLASINLAEKDCPGLKVDPIWDPSSYDTDLPVKIASGNAPDLFQVDGAKRIPQFASEGALASLDSLVKKDKLNVKKIFWTACVKEMTYKGHLYGLPRTCGNQSMLFYNKEMFKARGVTFPTSKWTYKDLQAAAHKLSGTYSVPHDPASMLRFGLAFNTDDFRTEQFMWDWGGDWLTPNLKTCTMTSKQSRAGLQWFHDLAYKVRGVPTAAQSSALPDYFSGWQKERYAMAYMGAWALDYAIGKYPGGTPQVHFPWSAALNPLGPKTRQSVMAGTAEVISKTSTHKNAAWWLMKFVTQGPGAIKVAQYGADTPGAKALWTAKAVKAEFGPVLPVAFQANKTGRYPRLVPQYDKFWSTINSDMTPFWQDKTSVAAATSKACHDVTSQGLLP